MLSYFKRTSMFVGAFFREHTLKYLRANNICKVILKVSGGKKACVCVYVCVCAHAHEKAQKLVKCYHWKDARTLGTIFATFQI